ncbi:TnsA-like heteromeric transposase endonuclease subunit [Dactylosporangium sp. NPDC051484]|uniref:TnsA-like heteromeric transposase endonuclease subunit n=1 Tax=Dactylosporangium sp. NPDC051484 TaxID=3154942 RepID=UPI00344B18E6
MTLVDELVVSAAVDGRSTFAVRFVDGDGEVQRGRLGSYWQVEFEQVPPVRQFRWAKGTGSFAGWWWSETMAQHVGFESWLERDHAMLLDQDRDVVAFASQPFWLLWTQHGRMRRHAPDFFARRADGTAVVIDVRPDDRIEQADAEAFDATARACAEVGWSYRRVSTPDPVLVANVRWLARYRHPRCRGRRDVVEALLAVFAEPTGLFAGVAEVGDRLAVLPVAYHLLWRQVLRVDLTTEPLRPGSLVRVGRQP